MKKYHCNPYVFASPPGHLEISKAVHCVSEADVVVIAGVEYVKLGNTMTEVSHATDWHDTRKDALEAAARDFERGASDMLIVARELREKAVAL